MTKRLLGVEEYRELTDGQQLDLLHRDGVYVGKRRIDGHAVVLFQLYGFYVEVHYKQYRKQINHKVATDNPDILQPYINQINVRGLDGEQL